MNEQKKDHYVFVKHDENFRQRIAFAFSSQFTQKRHKRELFNMNDKFSRERIHYTQINESHNETHQNRYKNIAEITYVINFVCFLQREFNRMMYQSRRKYYNR